MCSVQFLAARGKCPCEGDVSRAWQGERSIL
jgi:hypothetical protein